MNDETLPIVSVTPSLQLLYTSKVAVAVGERRADAVIITAYEVK